MSEFGALSLVPPLLAIVLAIVTRRPLLSLFLGIWSGGIIATGGIGIGRTFEWITESIGDVFHANILVFTLLLGSGVALIWRLGGATAVRNWATERLETQRQEFIDHVEDVRERVIQVKREVDAAAPAAHDHDRYVERDTIETLEKRLESTTTALADIESELESLEVAIDGLERTVDGGFENFESALEGLLERTETLEDRETILASAVLDLREQQATMAARERRHAQTAQLKLAASRLGVREAACEACSTTISIAQITEPACPHCAATFTDVESKSSFFSSHTLVTGDPPALQPRTENAVTTDDDAGVFESVEAVSSAADSSQNESTPDEVADE